MRYADIAAFRQAEATEQHANASHRANQIALDQVHAEHRNTKALEAIAEQARVANLIALGDLERARVALGIPGEAVDRG